MPTATLRFTLPDEDAEYRAARLGREALSVLWDIDQHCRSLLKYGSPTEAERLLAESIRTLIRESPENLLE